MIGKLSGGILYSECSVDRLCCDCILQGKCTWIADIKGAGDWSIFVAIYSAICGNRWRCGFTSNYGVRNFIGIVTFITSAIIGCGGKIVGFSFYQIINRSLNSAIDWIGKASVNYICVITGRGSVINFVTREIGVTIWQPAECCLGSQGWNGKGTEENKGT